MTGRRILHDAPGHQVRPMTALDRTVLLLAVLWAVAMLFVLAAVAFSSTVTTQVSHGLPTSTVYLPSLPQATGARVVYVQDATTLGAHELWSAPIVGGVALRLSNVLAPGQSVKFQIATNGAHVIYQTDQTTRGVPDLYSVPITGGASVKLSMDLASLPGQVRDFLASPDSQRAYFAADGAVNNLIELWRVDVAGGPSTRLNAAISGNYDVFEYHVSPQDQIVYRVGRATVGGHELWTVPGNGRGSQARKISRSMVSGGGVNDTFKITQDGERVLYIADAEDNGEFNLYAVGISGGASQRLNAVSGGVRDFREKAWSAGGVEVCFRQTIGAVTSWWSVPITGGTPVPVPPPVEPPVTSPDGRWTAHHAASVLSLTRGACTTQIGRPVVTTFLNRPAYSIDPSSKRVVLVSGGDVWSSAISGSVCPLFADGFESGGVTRWTL